VTSKESISNIRKSAVESRWEKARLKGWKKKTEEELKAESRIRAKKWYYESKNSPRYKS